MDWQRIEALAEKYWEGTTTEAEEAELHMAVKQPDAPKSLEPLAALLGSFAAEREVTLSAEAEERLQFLAREGRMPEGRQVFLRKFWLQVAAVVLLAVALFWVTVGDLGQANEPQLASQQEAEESYEEVRSALLLISQKMSRGTEPVHNLQEIHHVTEPLQSLGEFNRASEILHDGDASN